MSFGEVGGHCENLTSDMVINYKTLETETKPDTTHFNVGVQLVVS